MRQFAIRLALSDPMVLFSQETALWTEQHFLRSRLGTHAWAGAYQLFGAPWKNCLEFNSEVLSASTPVAGEFSPVPEDVEVVPSPTAEVSPHVNAAPPKKVCWANIRP